MNELRSSSMPAYRYFVNGRVQGVGYRYFVLREAEALGITGFARNLPDGRVEVVAEGPADILGDFEARLRKGPAFAHVADVERAAAPSRWDTGSHPVGRAASFPVPARGLEEKSMNNERRRVTALKSVIRDVPDFPKKDRLQGHPTLQGAPGVPRRRWTSSPTSASRCAPTRSWPSRAAGSSWAGPRRPSGRRFRARPQQGKLPRPGGLHVRTSEYGTDCVEIHEDARPGASGHWWSTTSSPPAAPARATGQLVRQLGAELRATPSW